MSREKRALLFTYYWPPGSGPGVQRWLKFCKFLPDFAWHPEVVTVKNGSYPAVDHTLVKEIPNQIKVVQTQTLEPFRLYNLLHGKNQKQVKVAMGSIKDDHSFLGRVSNYIRSNFFIPDARIGWNSFAFKAACKIIEQQRPDVIITTGPPHSTHLVGLRLKEKFGIPWVADFRDPWTNVYYNRYLMRTERTQQKDKALEDKVLKHASSVIVVSNRLKEEFSDRCDRITVISNGFDEGDFGNLQEVPAPEKFTLAYVGNLKTNQNVEALWAALAELMEKVPDFSSHFVLRCTGNVHGEVTESWKRHGINSIVKLDPFVPHEQSVQRMREGCMLFFPVPDEPGNESILTGKVFEYLASRRPLLPIGPVNGEAAKLLKECGKEEMMDYADREGMKVHILRFFEDFMQHRTLLETGNEKFMRYTRKNLAGSLAACLDKALQP